MSNIIIIGAGWYGCYASLLLQDKYNIILIEKNEDIFNNSSYYNQNRLHLGFHYPRSYNTRKLCLEGYKLFKSKFGFLSSKIDKNYYLISNNSIIDYNTYNSIYKYENYNYKEIENNYFNNIDKKLIEVDEEIINSEKTKKYFKENLKCKILFNTLVKKIEYNNKINIILNTNEILKCDLVIDCSLNSLNLSKKKYVYEKTLSLMYKKKLELNFNAITIMDGKFISLYPRFIDDNIYTLTDVEFTPLLKSNNIDDIINFTIDEDIINDRKNKIIEKTKYYYPNFENDFEYSGYFLANKTKLISNNDTRECNIENIDDKIITINCGKIIGIFEMEEYFRKINLL